MRGTPVRTRARAEGIPVLQPADLRTSEAIKAIAQHALDLLIVVAYGFILPPAVLSLPTFGCINLHPSLLPRWRGAAPVERAIMSGDTETGVCVMQMDAGLDTGPVFATRRLHLDDTMTGDGVRAALASIGVHALVQVIRNIESTSPTPQSDEGAIYADKLTAADQPINWSRSSRLVARQIHALNSSAPAYTSLGEGDDAVRVRLLQVEHTLGDALAPAGTVLEASAGEIEIACGLGKVSIVEASVLRGSGRRLSARALLNGYAGIFQAGNRFGA